MSGGLGRERTSKVEMWLFSVGELEVLEMEETSKAYAIKPKIYLGRKAFAAISDVVKPAGGHYFSAGKASKFIIPKEEQLETKKTV